MSMYKGTDPGVTAVIAAREAVRCFNCDRGVHTSCREVKGSTKGLICSCDCQGPGELGAPIYAKSGNIVGRIMTDGRRWAFGPGALPA